MLGGDPVCLHRAAYWHAQRVLDRDPEPEPPAPAAVAPVECFRCHGASRGCSVCGGAGAASLVAQAAALVTAATEPAGTCDHCGGSLDEDACTDYRLQTLCGARIETDRLAAVTARTAALRAHQSQPRGAFAAQAA